MERYKLEIVNDHGDRYIRCEPATDGSWVMFKDVEAQAARIAELEAALQEATRLLLQAHDTIFRLHDNSDVAARNLITKIRLGFSDTTTGGKDG